MCSSDLLGKGANAQENSYVVDAVLAGARAAHFQRAVDQPFGERLRLGDVGRVFRIEHGAGMEIAVRSEDVSKAYLISPDFVEVLSLDFTMNNGYCEVTIPDLGRYEIIYLVTGVKDLISDVLNGAPAAKEFPAVEPFPEAPDSTSVKKIKAAGIQ